MRLSLATLPRTSRGRYTLGLLAFALALVQIGSGLLLAALLQVERLAGYQLPPYLLTFFGRYLAGDPLAWGLTVVGAPLVEEVLARGLLLTALLWFYPKSWAVALGALLFAIAHLNWAQFIPALWLGLTLGLVYAQTGSVLLCICGHATYNVQFWLFPTLTGTDPYHILAPTPFWPSTSGLALGALILLLGLAGLWLGLHRIPPEERPPWRLRLAHRPIASRDDAG